MEPGQGMNNVFSRYRIDDPEKFKLAAFKTDDTAGLDKDAGEKLLAKGVKRLRELQPKLYAEHRWAVLVVLQGMDAAGKDGVITHVMSGLNPLGCEVHAFKQPGPEELDHDFLWRAAKRLPMRGQVVIFNRSHYEEVLVVRVHPGLLEKQNLPAKLADGEIWKRRFKDIRGFEGHLAHSGTLVLKFFLHHSKEEQRRRFLDRLDDPTKRW
jgi:PPK2 family polyphosphate:nucleotide phosphotransferase